jgi:hypothetical protein
MKRKMSFILILMLAATLAAAAHAADNNAAPVKKVVKKTVIKRSIRKAPAAPVKKAPVVVKPAEAAPQVTAPETAPAEEKLSDLKDDMNKGFASLKNQIDTVKSDNGDAKIGGVIFSQWSRITQNNTKLVANSFDITRAYLNITKKLDGGSSMRVTLDVKRVSDDVKNQNLFDYLKYAYFETPLNVSALQAVPFNLNAKVGLQQNAWIDWDEGIMGMRYIMKSFLDDEGLMSSADFGVGANGKITPAGLPEIEYNAVLVNGSGYATSETDAKKMLTVRVNSTVYEDPTWGKFIIGVFGNVASLNPSDLTYNGSAKQAGTTVALKGDWGMTYFEYLTGSTGSGSTALKIGGYSGQLVINAAPIGVAALNAFYRQDYYQPNTADTSKDINKSFCGLTYDWNKDIKLAADVQNSQTGTGATTSTFYLQTSVSF